MALHQHDMDAGRAREQAEAFRLKVVRSSVMPKTCQDYENGFNRIWNFAKARGFEWVTEEAFWSYLATEHQKSKDKNLPNKLRAMLEFQFALNPERLGGHPFWRERAISHYAFRGLRAVAEQTGVPRGAITLSMFLEMRKAPPFQGLERRAKMAIQILFFAALRSGELIRMTVRDFDLPSSILLINQNKGGRRAKLSPQVYSKKIVIQEARNLLEEVKGLPDHIPFAFQHAPKSKWDDCIRESASILNWDKRLRWTCHSLRHGGIQLIKQVLGSKEQVLFEATKVTPTTRARYLLTNEERLLLLMAGRGPEAEIPEDEEKEQPPTRAASVARKRSRVDE